jgi:hypothetical protein
MTTFLADMMHRQWAKAILNCRLHVIPGTSYHLATTHVAECARMTLEFPRQLR